MPGRGEVEPIGESAWVGTVKRESEFDHLR